MKLDGRTVVADGLEVGDLAKLPMLERNEGLAALFSRMQDVSKRFVDQRGKCEKDPQNDGLYVELLDISAEKNRLQDQIDRELKMSFNLAKRMAAVSIAQTNDTIARARAKMDEGKIKEALEILDGASAAMKRRRLLHRAAERAEAENLQIKELAEYNQIELFRISAIMAFTSMLYRDRIARVNEIAYESVHDLLEGASLFTGKNSLIIHSFADQILSLVSTLPLDGIHTGHLVGFFRGVSAMFGLSTLALENGAGVEQADRLLSSSMDWDFTRYYASRAVDDMETRDGWDRFDATEEACRYIGVCRHVGVKVPDDAMIVVTRMKLLVGYEDHDPHGGMIDYERLLSESKVCRDVCELQSCVGNHYITSEDLVKLACEFNTMCLAFHLAEGGERDGDFAQRAVKNGADYEVANKLCMAMNGK